MGMSFSDFCDAFEYAEEKCAEATEKCGRDIRPEPYSMYDGRKGIYIQLYFGSHLFIQCATGIWENLSTMKKAIDRSIARIIAE